MIKYLVVALVLASSTASADRGSVYVRGGFLRLIPFSTSRELELSNVHGPASLAVMDGPIVGSGTTLDPVTTAAVIVGFAPSALGGHIAFETVLAPPIHAKFRATGTLAGQSIAPTALGTVPTGIMALGPQLGEADAAPPVVTVVYRMGNQIQPYVGAGASVLFAYNAHATNAVLTEASQPRFHIDPAPGFVMQAGLDARVWGRVYARLDIKYIALMTAHATVDNIRVRTPDLPLFDTVAVGTAVMDVTLNPLVIQIGVGVDFW